MFSFWNLLISYAFEKAVVRLDLFYSQLPTLDNEWDWINEVVKQPNADIKSTIHTKMIQIIL